ncbi:hypothetical protein AWW66_25840 [Micromonospora rosaria]|uniref:Flavin reductase n=1 Tax=Micromonospora rosaria TaxID=47874 RepID=A0A136PL16_9ACTN|nr:hypothetical protein [Micromonospora rosaria]KXK59150.1 hypothetical protein AWW66_25840 [Micromonospora rosaria]
MRRPHLPLRPLWICAACARPWPCGEARVDLVRRYADDPAGLAGHLAGLLREATTDLDWICPEPPDPATIRRRFLGWSERMRHG